FDRLLGRPDFRSTHARFHAGAGLHAVSQRRVRRPRRPRRRARMTSLLLFVGFTALILVGVPIAFGMIIAVAVAILASGTMPIAMIGTRMDSGVETFTFLAVPMFILAGSIMEQSGISGASLSGPF